MEIRLATVRDIPSLCELEKVCFSKPWSEKSFLDSFGSDYYSFVVAVEKEKIVGYGGIYIPSHDGEITDIAVLPEFRGKGYGKRLTEALCEIAENKNCNSVMLDVRVSNTVAKKLYLSLGFTLCGIEKNQYEAPREDGELMKLELR